MSKRNYSFENRSYFVYRHYKLKNNETFYIGMGGVSNGKGFSRVTTKLQRNTF